MATRLHILDGARSIGGTKMILEEDGRGIILDFGLNYKRMGLFFEEYLSPRSSRGAVDYITMGLLPGFRDLYREDLLTQHPRLEDLPELGIRIEAVLLSHPHFDHTGMGGFLREDIPFYGSGGTALTSKASQDIRSDPSKEVVYLRPRLNEGYLVRYPRKKAEGEKIAQQRPWRVICGELSGEFMAFWEEFWLSRVRLVASEPRVVGHHFKAGPFGVRAWPVDHSAPGALGFAVETSGGWVIYTGDLRMHGYARAKTERFIEEVSRLKPIRAVITEGTRAGPAKGPGPGEEEVAARIMEVAKAAEGKALNAEFPFRHPERLLTFARAARELGRSLVLSASDFYTARAIAVAVPELREELEKVLIYQEDKAQCPGWEKGIYENYGDRLVQPRQISENVGDYLLSFRFWNINRLLDIPNLEGGVHIYSTSEPHSEEQEWDMKRLRNWLDYFGISLAGDPEENPKDPLHASGHASGQDLLDMIEALSPREVIPIHTEHWEFFSQRVRCCPVREPQGVINLD